MPRGPRGERRPADAIGAVMVARIATGEVSESPEPKSGRTRSGAVSSARTKKLTSEQRRQIAKKAAAARWGS